LIVAQLPGGGIVDDPATDHGDVAACIRDSTAVEIHRGTRQAIRDRQAHEVYYVAGGYAHHRALLLPVNNDRPGVLIPIWSRLRCVALNVADVASHRGALADQ
jgi:hypothetical protein